MAWVQYNVVIFFSFLFRERCNQIAVYYLANTTLQNDYSPCKPRGAQRLHLFFSLNTLPEKINHFQNLALCLLSETLKGFSELLIGRALIYWVAN
jgi:hypothetical protein